MSQPELVGDRADVNGDGSVDIWDLVLVAQQLHEGHIQDAGGVAAPAATLKWQQTYHVKPLKHGSVPFKRHLTEVPYSLRH